MHTVRNRIASRPPTNKVALADLKPPAPRTSRQELSLITRGSALSEGPAMSFGMTPEQTAEKRPQKRRNAKGKKARKAAARKAAAAAASPVLNTKAHDGKGRSGKRRHGGQAVPPASPSTPPPAHLLAELEPGAERDLCLQAEPALALLLPSRPEPLVEVPRPLTQSEILPETIAARVLMFEPTPEPLVDAPEAKVELAKIELAKIELSGVEVGAAPMPALTLPDRPEPLVERPADMAEPTTDPARAETQAVPLPRSRSLVPARRQGLVDVIAFLLRDSGRRLARWSARRHKSRTEQAALRQAEARQLNLQRELEALDALRRNRR